MVNCNIYNDTDTNTWWSVPMHLYLQIDWFFSRLSRAITLAGLGSSRHALIRALAGSSKDSDRSGMVVSWWLHCFAVSKGLFLCHILKMNHGWTSLPKNGLRLLCQWKYHHFRSTQFLWVGSHLSFVWPSPGCACETGIPESSVLFLFFK